MMSSDAKNPLDSTLSGLEPQIDRNSFFNNNPTSHTIKGRKSENSRHHSMSLANDRSSHGYNPFLSHSKSEGDNIASLGNRRESSHVSRPHHHSGHRHSMTGDLSSYNHGRQRTHSHHHDGHHHHHEHRHSNESDIFFMIPRGVIIQYGPYTFHGVCDFRVERLQGLQHVLHKMGAKVKMIPNTDYVNRVHIWYMDTVICSCKITDLKYGGDGEMDPLCIHVAQTFDHAMRKAIHGLRNRVRLENHDVRSSAHMDPNVIGSQSRQSASKKEGEQETQSKEVSEQQDKSTRFSEEVDVDEEEHNDGEEEEQDGESDHEYIFHGDGDESFHVIEESPEEV